MPSSLFPTTLVGILAVLACGGADLADGGPDTTVPVAPSVKIDGILGAEEWKAARQVGQAGQRTIRWCHDEKNLFIACEGQGIATVFVARGDEIHVLHASARLGRAVYTKQDGAWKLKQGFDYQPPSDDFWKREKWRASVAGPEKSAFEFAISIEEFLGIAPEKKNAKREKPRALPPIAVVLWSPAGKLQLPKSGAEEIGTPQLLMGHSPESVPFDPTRWERWELAEE